MNFEQGKQLAESIQLEIEKNWLLDGDSFGADYSERNGLHIDYVYSGIGFDSIMELNSILKNLGVGITGLTTKNGCLFFMLEVSQNV